MEKELCSQCNPELEGKRRPAETHCLECGRPVCAFHGYPRYEGEIKVENFIGRICHLCLAEAAIASGS